ncbi:MAG: family 1 glycosylhydrolase [Planctomycetes bacterium]|nr:family 1 glycosylhydrolase [Planctomycetota bacterium]
MSYPNDHGAVLPRSQLDRVLDEDAFIWATGIEDTFITEPWPKTGRILDEYELTGHYDRWKADIDLIAGLGLRMARYGIPWHRIQPEPGVWNWEHADQPIDHLLARGIDPMLDLVHYGLPRWIDGAYGNPDFPALMAEYAARCAERYRGRVRWWTPLNEPRVTAWYCGKLGWWPPALRGWGGFVRVMLGVCRGICLSSQAIRAADPENVLCHVDATDLYVAADASLAGEAEHRQHIVFLALDLVSGRIIPGHPLHAWLLGHGATASDLEWFVAHRCDLDVVGINLYPLFSRKVLSHSSHGLRMRMPYAPPTIVDELADLYHQRYQRPVMITETASEGSVRRRRDWLDGSVAACARVRARGVPLIGYTWWPLFALVTWAYRQGERPPEDYLKQMGLWDLDRDLERIATPLVDAYRDLASGGVAAVGPLARLLTVER